MTDHSLFAASHSSLGRRLAAVLLLGLLAGCAQLESKVGQCEPGVEDLSTMATIASTKC
ncbi:MAG: hypothetical protein IE922_17395 [Sphingomonadales bacterium]|nr:hypothetical protein [Sphingomonadales bacterium]